MAKKSSTSKGGSSKTLHFDVSTGLKRVIGRDLITDAEVAIFELVKNSFDAGAKKVQLFFEEDRIAVIDDGSGMSFEDLKNKWLFVAYSSKRSEYAPDDYRDKIADRRHFAGSKGIGRFSSDRLGHGLRLQSRPAEAVSGVVHEINVDWDDFEEDDRRDFIKVPVQYRERENFDLPLKVQKIGCGTIIEILSPRAVWSRESLVTLKASLAKLINPFGAETDRFQLELIVPAEADNDRDVREAAKESGEELTSRSLVNGPIQNFIFSTLEEKTTFIEVCLSDDNKTLESSLVDRDEVIYRIREPNPYTDLENSGFKCQLYYLNMSAKQTFTRRMGVPSIQFGSVFVFRNGFRVFPIGEVGDDWFGIDRRKQQGYRRFLGTRDVIGRVDVEGDDESFQEGSSRNQGLIETQAVKALRDCFQYKCFRRLENYVVPVTWSDRAEKTTSDLSRLITDAGSAKVAKAVAELVGSSEIELLEYSQKLVRVLDERSQHFEASLGSLRAIAEKTRNKKLEDEIEKAERRFRELKRAEEEAIRKAEAERAAREEAEKKAAKSEERAEEQEVKYEEEKKRNLFLTSDADLDRETILNLHHQITIYGAEAHQILANKLQDFKKSKKIDYEDAISLIEQLSLITQKILSIARFATKANFRLESEAIEEDLGEFISQYVEEVGNMFLGRRIRISVENKSEEFVCKFKPIEISIVVDNLVSNARKAKASKVNFSISRPEKNLLRIKVSDNGRGIQSFLSEPERMFEKGVTSTDGSGLGLYHVRQILGEMGGSISVDSSCAKGAIFEIRVLRNAP